VGGALVLAEGAPPNHHSNSVDTSADEALGDNSRRGFHVAPFIFHLALEVRQSGNARITERTIEALLDAQPQLEVVWAAVLELLCHDALPLFSLIQRVPLAIEFAHSSLIDFLVVESVRVNKQLPRRAAEFWHWDESWLGVIAFMEERRSKLGASLVQAFDLHTSKEGLGLRSMLRPETMPISSRVASVLIHAQQAFDKVDLSANKLDGSCYSMVEPQVAQDAFSRVLDALISSSQLREIDLSENSLTKEACPLLLNLLNHSQVQVLNLSRNRLGHAGAKILTRSIARVAHLDLGYNFFFAEGGREISQALRVAHGRTEKLILDGNQLCRSNEYPNAFTLECVHELHELIRQREGAPLIELSLRVNDLDTRSKQALEASAVTFGRKVLV